MMYLLDADLITNGRIEVGSTPTMIEWSEVRGMMHWRPRYEPVTFASAVNVSDENLDTLNRARLPKYILIRMGEALREPVGVDVPGRGRLIHFAHGGLEGFYYDPATGEVICIHDWPGPVPLLVNSTLELFTRTVRAIIDAFPFSDGVTDAIKALDPNDDALLAAEERDIEQCIASAAKIRDRIREIDPPAMTPDGFWDDFCADVAIGDCST